MLQQLRVAPGTLVVAATWHVTGVGVVMLATTAVYVALAVYVWRRRGGSAGAALALVLVALLLWAGAYTAELAATDLAAIGRWGDLKYVGIVLLPPAWFAFAALFAGRQSWVSGRNLALLAIHPVVILVLLANAATHDLIRWYPREAAADPDAVAEVGPLFWPHLVYSGMVMWGSLILMVVALVRASRVYRRVTTILIISLVVPYVFNLLYNLDAGPFGRVDLTPFLLIGSCLVLVWGLFRFRLLGIRPVARGLVFETISEAVLVLDPLRRVVDANPAAERLLGLPLADAVGHPLGELLPEAADAVRDPPPTSDGLPQELVVTREGTTRRYEPTVVAMPDRQGPPIGWLVVLRDVTEHHRTLRSLRQLDEQRRSLLERVVTSQEEERRQVAGDIHDDAIQAMVAVTLQLQALGGRLSDPRSTELLERLAATATESVGRLRQLVFELRPPLLDEVGLAAAIDQYARRAGELAGFVAQVHDESAGELPDELRVVAYRIVQEALANVRAHAKAGRVAVRLEEVEGGVLARVSDDGVGFLPGLVGRRPAGHLGLISMREQAAMAGGWCRVASAPGMGTTVELWLPRSEAEAE
ncbi:MAG TPA: histidine kinase N-terminal 7TM domain-containing protein [Actinomycetota bacterium]|nr:histidine kinase N-terminal 7TM domain-containing protein [Actinomycetota bacterium]